MSDEKAEEKLDFIDKDNDGVDDRLERKANYILSSVMLSVVIPAFFLGMITFDDVKIVFYITSGLVGGTSVLKAILKMLIK